MMWYQCLHHSKKSHTALIAPRSLIFSRTAEHCYGGFQTFFYLQPDHQVTHSHLDHIITLDFSDKTASTHRMEDGEVQ